MHVVGETLESVVEQCNCSVWLPNDNAVRFCSAHHAYRRGDKKLVSVTQVLRTIWPLKPDFSAAQPEVLENARDRGVVTDQLFSAYVIGGLDRIPAGTRMDAVELFFKARRWWDGRKHGDVRSQVILADQELAGTCDVLDDDNVYDLKCTYDIDATYPLQLAAYGELHFATFGRPVKSLNLIHVTKRYEQPKIIRVDLTETLADWATMRDMWRLVRRRGKHAAA